MLQRWRLPILGGLATLFGLLAVWWTVDRVLLDRQPIVVGILHSQTGPMAISELSMVDAEVLRSKNSTPTVACSAARSAG